MERIALGIRGVLNSPEQLQDFASLADESNLDSLWVSEEGFMEDPFATLGVLVSLTRRIKLGLAASNPYTHHPAALASSSATLASISNGRFSLCIARGDSSFIQDNLGISQRHALQGLEDSVTIIRNLLVNEKDSYEGKVFSVKNGRSINPSKYKVPLFLGAMGSKGLSLAGRMADGVILNIYSSVEYVKECASIFRKSALKAGRNPDSLDIGCTIIFRPSLNNNSKTETSRVRLAEVLLSKDGELFLKVNGYDTNLIKRLRQATTCYGIKGASKLIADDMLHKMIIIGDEDECKRRIREYQEAGVNLPILFPAPQDFRLTLEMLKNN